MKTLIAALAAVTTVTALAAPAVASAQPGRWDNHGGGYNLNHRQQQLNNRIEIGARQGVITRREAADLRSQSYEIARLEARYRVNGLNARERADLDRRFDRLETRIARQVHDRDYGYGYGYGQRR